MNDIFNNLRLRLLVWQVWRKTRYAKTKWEKFCVLLGLRSTPSFEFAMLAAKALSSEE